MRDLYPEIEPFHHFFLETESEHSVYVEVSGNPQGLPVLFFHGGPCSGTKPDHRRYFDPLKYRIILFDQRGCGKSTPFGMTENNTTDYLIKDIERIRQHLSIEQWLLFGGSWGATLSLLYAQMYPKQVKALIIRGVFLAREKDLIWYMQEAAKIYPESWQSMKHLIAEYAVTDAVSHLYQQIMQGNLQQQMDVARAWSVWGAQLALKNAYQPEQEDSVGETLLKLVKMELHFAQNKYFIAENQILLNCEKIQHIPTSIIHGRFDLVCPMESAYSLASVLPQSELTVLPEGGHIAGTEDMVDVLIRTTDQCADCFSS